MNNFDKYISDFLNESIIDIPRNSLDPSVFEFPDDSMPILHPMVKVQIMNDIDTIRNVVPVSTYFMVGSILTRNYTPHSDIDVTVKISPRKDQMISAVFDVINNLNGRMAAGSTHPINYYIMQEDYDIDKADAVYDIANEVWIKEPKNTGIDVSDYMNDFQKTVSTIDFSANEIRRHIIDLEELKSLDKDKINGLQSKVEQKMSELETEIERLVSTYKGIKDLRKAGFEKDMSPTEIRKYGHKNKLPENVIYKMLERYYYFDFIKQLKSVMKDGEVTDSEIKDIKKAGQDFWK